MPFVSVFYSFDRMVCAVEGSEANSRAATTMKWVMVLFRIVSLLIKVIASIYLLTVL